MPPAKKATPAAKKAAPAAKKAAAPAKSAAQTTVTLRHLAAALSESHELPKKQAEAVLSDLVTMTTKHLKRGDKIRLTGLGILQVRKRAARMGRNPATGAAIKIKASKKVAFRVAKERFKSFRGAQPPRKLRWTNAGVVGLVRRYGDFAQRGLHRV
jgi:DNA-binding protein HU-beta